MSSSTPTPTPAPPPPLKTPLFVHPTAFLDPHAYIQGSHPITLSAHVVVHPRARLVSVHGPLTIGMGSMIGERSVVGGPAPDPREKMPVLVEGEGASPAVETIVGERVVVKEAVKVGKGARVGDGCVLEARVVVGPGVVLGKGSKICAGVKAEKDVEEGTVVWGSGQQKRVRGRMDVLEGARVKALDVEREATATLLKTAAAKASLGKTRR